MANLNDNGPLPPLTAPKTAAARVELWLKRALFNCRGCGQCLLTQCDYSCPMQCPKGLRNGPCGGMVNGLCEVHQERPCVWTGILERVDRQQWPQQLRQPVNAALFGTSSWSNLLSGKDHDGRVPVDLAQTKTALPPATGKLADAIKAGKFAITVELRTPHQGNAAQLKRRLQEARVLHGRVDAISVTSHPGALSPEEFGRALAFEMPLETVLPLVGRDRQPAGFAPELQAALAAARSSAILCLTGDYAGTAPFPMDGAQVLHALRGLPWGAERPLFGAALHFKAQHSEIVLARTVQKALAGAEIFFSQALTGDEPVATFLSQMRSLEALKALPVMLGVPLVGSEAGLRNLLALPGMNPQSTLVDRFKHASDIRATGLALATELAQTAQSLRELGVAGIHVMPFGIAARETAAWIESLRPAETRHSVITREQEGVRS